MSTPLLPATLAFLQGLDQSTALDPALAQAIDAASAAFAVDADALAALPRARLLDVRRAAVVTAAPQAIPGARWCNPVGIGLASATGLPAPDPAHPLVVYCVHGHAVSRSVMLALRAQGHDARFLQGGIAAWVATGRPVVAPAPLAGASGDAP